MLPNCSSSKLRFDVFTTVKVWVVIFCVMTPCSLIEGCRVKEKHWPSHSSGVDSFPTGRPGLKPRSGHVGFMVHKVTLRQVFSEYFCFACQFSFHLLLHIHRVSSGDGIIRQLWADALSGLSLTPHQKKNNLKILRRNRVPRCSGWKCGSSTVLRHVTFYQTTRCHNQQSYNSYSKLLPSCRARSDSNRKRWSRHWGWPHSVSTVVSTWLVDILYCETNAVVKYWVCLIFSSYLTLIPVDHAFHL
jgi:hypothetical protein